MNLTDDMVVLLQEGATTSYGRICLPMEVARQYEVLRKLVDAKLAWWDGTGTPLITDSGRAAVGGPSRDDLLQQEQEAIARRYRPTEQSYQYSADAIPFSPLDARFRAGQTMVYAMVEHRTNPAGTAVLLSIDGDWHIAKWFPKVRLEIQRSREVDRFMVVQMPGRLANEKKLPTQQSRPRLTATIAWTDEQEAAWRSVTDWRLKVNNSIQRNSRSYRRQPQRFRFGETA